MNVQVNGRYLMQRVTGVQRYAREVVSRLGNKVEVVSPGASAAGIRGHLWEQLVLPWKLRSGVLWSPCATGPLAIQRQVVTIHDCAFFDCADSFSPAFARWYQCLVPRLARRARRVLTVSEYSRNRICELFRIAPENVVAAPNGLGCEWKPASSAAVEATRRSLDLSQPYVLSVGSIEPRKNLQRLLAAWEMLGPAKDGVILVLAGAAGRVFRDAGLGSPPADVRFIGYVRDCDLRALYTGAEAFVFPSLYEGFGLPVLEAMACGTPVVCSQTTALPEVAADAALLVDPLDVEAIAHGLAAVLQNRGLRVSLRERGLCRAKHFSWDETARRVWNVLASAN